MADEGDPDAELTPERVGADFDALALARTFEILQKVVTRYSDREKLKFPEERLHHYTSLDTARKILETDDVRLTHVEYSNDQTEMLHARHLIGDELDKRKSTPAFFANVAVTFALLGPTLDAYVFCMSEGDTGAAKPQDRLSQWRAYGQDGRGACISLDANKLAHFAHHMAGLRINPVIYNPGRQLDFVRDILVEGEKLEQAHDLTARAATLGALTFAMPLMKAEGFSEEREWRLIFMPPVSGPPPILEFCPRRDFLAPFLRLKYIWQTLRPAYEQIPALKPNPPLNVPLPTGQPFLPVTDVMVGPSGHQPLNLKAMKKLLAQTPWPLSPGCSEIPYRSLG